MKNISATEMMSITVSAGETYVIVYAGNYALDIMNDTGGDILVSTKNSFNGSEYLTIPAAAAYNNYRYMRIDENKVYIKANAEGTVCIAARRG